MNNSKKILIVTHSHPWFDHRLYYKICKSLLKKDVIIKLLTSNTLDNPYLEESKISVDYISPSYNKIKKLIYWIKKGKEFKPDITITVEPLTLLVGYYLKLFNKSRFVYDCHEFYSVNKKKKNKFIGSLYQLFEFFFSKRADAIISVSDEMKKYFINLNKNIFICPNLPVQNILSPINNNNDKIYDLIYTGAIYFERSIKLYLETVNLFKQNNLFFKFCVIGVFKDDSVKKFFFNYITKNKLQDYVIFKDYMPHDELLKEIKKSKASIFIGNSSIKPSYDYSIPVKIFDSMSQAIPVIINNLQMLSQLIIKSDCGWIIDESAQALFFLLKEIIYNDDLLFEKGSKGLNYLTNNLTWECCETELYKSLNLN
jgi:glycosyltransferase involved in cell wall biosynthesis